MSPSQTIWLDLSCADFLAAIKALKPPRMPKTHALKELQIGLVKGEAIFCMEGAQTRCPATGEWNASGLDVAVCLRGWSWFRLKSMF